MNFAQCQISIQAKSDPTNCSLRNSLACVVNGSKAIFLIAKIMLCLKSVLNQVLLSNWRKMLLRKRMARVTKLMRTKIKKHWGISDTAHMIKERDVIQFRYKSYPYIIWSVQFESFLNYQKIKKLIMATYIPRARLFFLRNLILKKFNVKIKINCCTKMQPGLSFFYRIAKQ